MDWYASCATYPSNLFDRIRCAIREIRQRSIDTYRFGVNALFHMAYVHLVVLINLDLPDLDIEVICTLMRCHMSSSAYH